MKKDWADCVNTMFQKRNADEATELRKAVKKLDTINSKRKKQEDAEFKEAIERLVTRNHWRETAVEQTSAPTRNTGNPIPSLLRSPLGDRVSQLPPSIFDVLAFIYFISFIFS
jgi:hypothetical protein